MATDILATMKGYLETLTDKASELPEKGAEALKDFKAYVSGVKPEEGSVLMNFREWVGKLPDKGAKYGKQALDGAFKLYEENLPDELKPEQGGFLDNNKGGLIGGLLMGALALFGLEMGPIGAIIMLLLGAIAGGLLMGDKGGGLGGAIANMFGFGKSNEGDSPAAAPEGPGKGQGAGTGAPAAGEKKDHVLMLKADGTKANGIEDAQIMLAGHFEGEGANRKFAIDLASVKDKDGKFPTNAEGKILYSSLKDSKLQLTAEGENVVATPENGKIITSITSAIVASRAAAPAAPAATSPTTPAPGTTPAAPGTPAPAADAKPASSPATAVPGAPKPQEKPKDVFLDLNDKSGNPILVHTLYFDKEGNLTTEKKADVVMNARYEPSSETFRITDKGARNKAGEMVTMPLYQNMTSIQTLPVVNGRVNLSTDDAKGMITKVASSAINDVNAMDSAAEHKRYEENRKAQEEAMTARIKALKKEPEIEILNHQTDKVSGKEIATIKYTGVDEKTGAIFTLNLDTETKDKTMRVNSGSIVNEYNKPLDKGVVVKPFDIEVSRYIGGGISTKGSEYKAGIQKAIKDGNLKPPSTSVSMGAIEVPSVPLAMGNIVDGPIRNA